MTSKHSKSVGLGCFLVILSGLLFSLLAAAIQWGSKRGFSSMQLLMFQSSIQLLFALIFSENGISSLKQEMFTVKKQLWIYVILRGVIGGIGALCYVYASSELPLGDAVAITSLYPIVTTFVAFGFLNEQITKYHCIALFLSIGGGLLIAQPSWLFANDTNDTNIDSHDSNSSLGYFLASLGSICGGIIFVLIRKARGVNVMFLIISQGICSFIQGFVFLFIFNQTFVLNGLFIDPDIISWICVLSLGVFSYLGQWTTSKAGQMIPAALSSLIRSSGIIWSYLWEIIFFQTIPGQTTIIGASLILIGIFIVSYEKLNIKSLNNKKKE